MRLWPATPPLAKALVNRVLTVLIFAVVLLVVYRYLRLDSPDPYKCKALLNDGRWLGTVERQSSMDSLQTWQAPGCMMHQYTAKDISACTQGTRLLFIGDSVIRQIYGAVAKKLDPKGAERELAFAEKHKGQSFRRGGVVLEFIWDPFLNSSKLREELLDRLDPPGYRSLWNTSTNDPTSIFLVGAGLWHARQIKQNPTRHFKLSMDTISLVAGPRDAGPLAAVVFDQPSELSAGQRLLLIAPVQAPIYESLSQSRAATITPQKIDSMNEYLQQLVEDRRAHILWSYSRMTWEEPSAFEDDGLHVTESVARQKADVLLNIRCNSRRAKVAGYPFDGTCCSEYTHVGWIQWIILASGLGMLPIVAMVAPIGPQRLWFLPSSNVSRSLLVVNLAMCYCFFADRTQVLNKVHKQFSSSEFNILCGISMTIGVLSLRQSRAGLSTPWTTAPGKRLEAPFLSRDQTDEWKGWMQFLILVYHYTGASRVLWIYQVIRVLVASYLFMTGFGHATFFYVKGDYSLKRFASVVIRLNLLSCVLPYSMRTNYIFYYFSPLVTFWYVVIYFTMKIGRERNESLWFLISKILVSAASVTAIIKVPGILEETFLLLKYSSRIEWNAAEWRFRVYLDMFIVYLGMLVGVFYVKTSRALSGERMDSPFARLVRNHFRVLHLGFVVVSTIMLPAFWLLIRKYPDKYQYNRWQPYISWVPILSFIFLRNSSTFFRNTYSSFFAWLGRCSLETFTLQFHIWLAADTKGLLSLGVFGIPGTPSDGRWHDFVLLTPIFFWVSWHVAAATGKLTSWIIDPREGRADIDVEEGKVETPKQSTELPRVQGLGQMKQSSFSRLEVVTAILREDLKLRLAIIVIVLWFCNMTYT